MKYKQETHAEDVSGASETFKLSKGWINALVNGLAADKIQEVAEKGSLIAEAVEELGYGTSDETGEYNVGDLIVEDETTIHAPVSCPRQGCVCLAVTTAPIRLTGWMGRLINPFLR